MLTMNMPFAAMAPSSHSQLPGPSFSTSTLSPARLLPQQKIGMNNNTVTSSTTTVPTAVHPMLSQSLAGIPLHPGATSSLHQALFAVTAMNNATLSTSLALEPAAQRIHARLPSDFFNIFKPLVPLGPQPSPVHSPTHEGSSNSAKKRTQQPQNSSLGAERKRRRVSVEESTKDEEEDEASSIDTDPQDVDSASDSATSKKLIGERRLVIRFETYGTVGKDAPRMGKNGLPIPNGLIGYFTAYCEDWRVEISYDERTRLANSEGIICVTWSVTNLKTDIVHSRTETLHEASARSRNGRTITNQLFREAMLFRAKNLQKSLQGESNPVKIANIQSLIKTLQPTRFTQGPLFFGLQHRCVRDRVIELLAE